MIALDRGHATAYTLALMQLPSPGQRWISTSEPSLGLGLVRSVDGDRVKLHYPAAEENRIYAFESAPLVRVALRSGRCGFRA